MYSTSKQHPRLHHVREVHPWNYNLKIYEALKNPWIVYLSHACVDRSEKFRQRQAFVLLDYCTQQPPNRLHAAKSADDGNGNMIQVLTAFNKLID